MPMMKPKSSHRYRVCGTPVRTGCVTCKIRRVKCGEEKPFCKRCTSTGRKCDGYRPPVKAVTPGRGSPGRAPSLSPTEDPVEQRIFSFFTTFSAPMLAGNFSSAFWEQRVLQASATEPSIRHAVIAIGAIHQDFIGRHQENGNGVHDGSMQAFAFRQYTKAISHLQSLMATRTQQLDVTLISCILFICFDCVIGNLQSAIIHLHAGLRILEDIKLKNAERLNSTPTSSPTSTDEWEKEFAPLLLGLGVQAASFIDPKYTKDRIALWTDLAGAGISTQPTEFKSLDEARHALDTLAAKFVVERRAATDRITEHKIPNPDSPLGRKHVALLQKWTDGLEYLIADSVGKEPPGSKAQCAAALLQAHSVLVSISIGLPHPAVDKFDKILALCEYLIASQPSVPMNLKFQTDVGVVALLFFTALKGSNRNLQLRAIDLLSLAPRREGMWDAEDAFRIAVRVVEDSENGVTGTIFFHAQASQNEATSRVWKEIGARLQSRMTWPFGQRREPPMQPSTTSMQRMPITSSTYIEPSYSVAGLGTLETDQHDVFDDRYTSSLGGSYSSDLEHKSNGSDT